MNLYYIAAVVSAVVVVVSAAVVCRAVVAAVEYSCWEEFDGTAFAAGSVAVAVVAAAAESVVDAPFVVVTAVVAVVVTAVVAVASPWRLFGFSVAPSENKSMSIFLPLYAAFLINFSAFKLSYITIIIEIDGKKSH